MGPESLNLRILGEGPDIDLPETNQVEIIVEPRDEYERHIYLDIRTNSYDGGVEGEVSMFLTYTQFNELTDALCEYLYEYEEEHGLRAIGDRPSAKNYMGEDKEPDLELVWE